MGRRRCTALALLALVGCGRVAFESSSDGSVAIDGGTTDGVAADSMPADLLFHVTFEGGADDVAGGRTPTCPGCAFSFSASPGGTGQAIRLSGAECFEYADDPMLRPASFTLSAWFRVDGAQTFSMLGKAFDADASESNSYELWVANVGTVLFAMVNGADPYVSADMIVPATWYHVAGTVDSGTKRVYVDGVERMMGTASATSYDTEPLRIGCDRGNGFIGNYFVGNVDDVRLYGRALAPAEIAALATQPP